MLPRVTFALFAYNQEKYIREAVEGALAQNYDNLEIILSDDCSTDGTFEIIQEMSANYDGAGSVILNRNARNLGLAGHIATVMKMVSTDFVVLAAGDDISLPIRTRDLVSIWLSSGRKAKSIHSMALDIDAFGRKLPSCRSGSSNLEINNIDIQVDRNVWVLGATQAIDMDVIRCFPQLCPKVVNEDVVLPFRAISLGYVHYASKVLIEYRRGVGLSDEASRVRDDSSESLEIRSRPYYCFVQKCSDSRFMKLTEAQYKTLKQRRAEALFPVALRRKRIWSQRKTRYFVERCRCSQIVKELLKYHFPKLLRLKQAIQYKAATSSRFIGRS